MFPIYREKKTPGDGGQVEVLGGDSMMIPYI